MDFYDPESPTEDDIDETLPPAITPQQQQQEFNILDLDLASVPLPAGEAPPLPSVAPPTTLPPIPTAPPTDEAVEDNADERQNKKKKKKKKKLKGEGKDLLYYEVESVEKLFQEEPVQVDLMAANPSYSVGLEIPIPASKGPTLQNSVDREPSAAAAEYRDSTCSSLPKEEDKNEEKKMEEPQTLAKKLLSKALGNVSRTESALSLNAEDSSSAGEMPALSPPLSKLKFSMKPANVKVQKVSFALKSKKNALKSSEEEDDDGIKPEEDSSAVGTLQPARFNFKKSKGELFRPDQEDNVELLMQNPLFQVTQNALALQAAVLLQQEKSVGVIEFGMKKSSSDEEKSDFQKSGQEDKETRMKSKDERDTKEKKGREKRFRDSERSSRWSRHSEERDNREYGHSRKSKNSEDSTDLDSLNKDINNVHSENKLDSDETQNDAVKELVNVKDSSEDQTTQLKYHSLAKISELYKDVLDDEEGIAKSEEPSLNVSQNLTEDSSNVENSKASNSFQISIKDTNRVEATTMQSQEMHQQNKTDIKESIEKHEKFMDLCSTTVEKESNDDSLRKSKKLLSESISSSSKEKCDRLNAKTLQGSGSDNQEQGDRKKKNRSRSKSWEKEKSKKKEQEFDKRRNRSRSDSRDRVKDRRNKRRSRSESRERDWRGRDRSRSRERHRRRRSDSHDRDGRKRKRSRSESREIPRRQQHRDRSRSKESANRRRHRSRSRSRNKESKRKERSLSRSKDKGKEKMVKVETKEGDRNRSERQDGAVLKKIKAIAEKAAPSSSSETTEFSGTELKEKTQCTSVEIIAEEQKEKNMLGSQEESNATVSGLPSNSEERESSKRSLTGDLEEKQDSSQHKVSISNVEKIGTCDDKADAGERPIDERFNKDKEHLCEFRSIKEDIRNISKGKDKAETSHSDKSQSHESEEMKIDTSSGKKREKHLVKDLRKSEVSTNQLKTFPKKDGSMSPSKKGTVRKTDRLRDDSDSDNGRIAKPKDRSPEKKYRDYQHHSSSEDSEERVGRRHGNRSRAFDCMIPKGSRDKDCDSEEEMFRRRAKNWSRNQAMRHYKRRHKMSDSSDEDTTSLRASSKSTSKENNLAELTVDKKSSATVSSLLFDLKDVLLPGESLPSASFSKKMSSSVKNNENLNIQETNFDKGSSDMDLDVSDNEEGEIVLFPHSKLSGKCLSTKAVDEKSTIRHIEVSKKNKSGIQEKEKKKPEKISFSLKGKGNEMKLKLKSRNTIEALDDEKSNGKATKLYLPKEIEEEDESPSVFESMVKRNRAKLTDSEQGSESYFEVHSEKQVSEKLLDAKKEGLSHSLHQEPYATKGTTVHEEKADLLENKETPEKKLHLENSESESKSINDYDDSVEQKDLMQSKKTEILLDETKPRSGPFHFKSIPLWELDKEEDTNGPPRATPVVQTWGFIAQNTANLKCNLPLSLGLDYGSSSEEESEGVLKKSPKKKSSQKEQKSSSSDTSKTADELQEKSVTRFATEEVSSIRKGKQKPYSDDSKKLSNAKSELTYDGENFLSAHSRKSDSREKEKYSKVFESQIGERKQALKTPSSKSLSEGRDRSARYEHPKLFETEEVAVESLSQKIGTTDRERVSRIPHSKWDSPEGSPHKMRMSHSDYKEKPSKLTLSEAEETYSRKKARYYSSEEKEKCLCDSSTKYNTSEEISVRRNSKSLEIQHKDTHPGSEKTSRISIESNTRFKDRGLESVRSRQDDTSARKSKSDVSGKERNSKDTSADFEETISEKKYKKSSSYSKEPLETVMSRDGDLEETKSSKLSKLSHSDVSNRSAKNVSSKLEETLKKQREECESKTDENCSELAQSSVKDRSEHRKRTLLEQDERNFQRADQNVKTLTGESVKRSGTDESDRFGRCKHKTTDEKELKSEPVSLEEKLKAKEYQSEFNVDTVTIPIPQTEAKEGSELPETFSSLAGAEPKHSASSAEQIIEAGITKTNILSVIDSTNTEQIKVVSEATCSEDNLCSIDHRTDNSDFLCTNEQKSHHEIDKLPETDRAQKDCVQLESNVSLDQVHKESSAGTADSTTSSLSVKSSSRISEKTSELLCSSKSESHFHLTQVATSPRAKPGRFGTASWSSGTKRRERGLRPPIETIVAVKSKASSPGASPNFSVSKTISVSSDLSVKTFAASDIKTGVAISEVLDSSLSVSSSQTSVCTTQVSSISTSSSSFPKVGKIQIVLGRKVAPLQESPLAAASEDSDTPVKAPEVTVGFPVMVLTGTRKAGEKEPSEMIWPECRAVAAKEVEKEEESSEEEDSSSEEVETDSSDSDREKDRRRDLNFSRDSRRDFSRRELDMRRKHSRDSRDKDDHRRSDDSKSHGRRDEDSERRWRYGDDRRRRRDDDDRRRRDEDIERRRRERERERERDREKRERERERQRELEREQEEEHRYRRRSSRSHSRDRSLERQHTRERDRDKRRDKSPGSPDRSRDKLINYPQGRNVERPRLHSPDRFRERSPGRFRYRSPDRFRDKSPQRFRDKSPDRLRNKSPDRLRNKSPDRLRNKSPDRLRDKSPDRLRSRSPEYIQDRTRNYGSRKRGRSPLRGSPDSSPGRDRERRRNFSQERVLDCSRERSPASITESPLLQSHGRQFENQQRFLENSRDQSPDCSLDSLRSHSPGRDHDKSIDKFQDLSRARGHYGQVRSRSNSQEQEKDLNWSKESDVKPVVSKVEENPAYVSKIMDAQSVPSIPAQDFFHPVVSGHIAQPPPRDQTFSIQQPLPAGQTFSQYPEGYVDPQVSWQASTYPSPANTSTLQIVQHQYQSMGYPPDQALALATQYLAATISAQQPGTHPNPVAHDTIAYPIEPVHQMYVGSNSAFQGPMPLGQPPPGFLHGHAAPPTDFSHPPPPHTPYGTEAFPPSYAPPQEAHFPYESFAEMEAHLQAEMHPDPREAALFGDLPNSRRLKGMKRQKEGVTHKDYMQQEGLLTLKAKANILRVVEKSEAKFETSISAEPDFDFDTSSLAEPEEGQIETEQGSIDSQPVMEDVNEHKDGEDVVSSTNSAEMGDHGSKEENLISSDFRPLKVKSRWRRNSEAEATSSTPPPPLSKRLLQETQEQVLQESENADQGEEPKITQESTVPPPPPCKRLRLEAEAEQGKAIKPEDGCEFPVFEVITENIHLTERKKSKSMKRMICDCTTSKNDRAMGIPACGEDCLNRMLMIECGSRCPCLDYCSNKRFQKKQYGKTEPFNCGPGKGWGLQASEDMPNLGTFVMEYVGELLDYREFVRRTRQYAKRGMQHHYFMALNADELIDATLKGSNSRFMNHSCDPNCETQKWTVNGELRVGFFTKKPVAAGDELTFDYQFEFYGTPQKCCCGAENCRGFIGGQKNLPARRKKDKTIERRKVGLFQDEMLDEDMESMTRHKDGMKVKAHVLELCRLMVRAEKADHRLALLKIIQDTTEINCLRLFLGYHGLPLLWSWMVDIGMEDSEEDCTLKTEILKVLKKLPINNRTILKESKIMVIVEKWANLPPPPALPDAEADSVSEPLPLPVPPDRPVVSILALHKDSKDQKAGKKRVTFADEAASSDSDVSDSLKVSSTINEGSGDNKVSTSDSTVPSTSADIGETCAKEGNGEDVQNDTEKFETGTVSNVESDAEVTPKLGNTETECNDTSEKSEAVSTKLLVDGPMTRHRANRRPSVIPNPKTKRKGGRRRLSIENENKDADSTSPRENACEDDVKSDMDASETSKVFDTDISNMSSEGIPSEGSTDDLTEQKEDTALDFSSFHANMSGKPSHLLEQSDLGENFAKPLDQIDENTLLSSESDSTDSDMAANIVCNVERENTEMHSLSSEATYSELSYDVEGMDDISSIAAELLSGWNDLKELYKIPKKQRVEERKRTERELDSVSFKEPEKKEPDPYAKWKKKKKADKPKKKEADDEEQKKRIQPDGPKMSKAERRQLFEAQVKAEDEMNAEFQRQQEVMLQQQQAAFLYQQDYVAIHGLNTDHSLLATQGQVFDPSLQQYNNSNILTPEHQQALLLASQATAAGGDMTLAAQQIITQPGLFQPAPDQFQQLQSVYPGNSGGHLYPDRSALQQQHQLALQHLVHLLEEDDVPPPPSPPEQRDLLPPHWKTARDAEGRMYYYHTLTRATQWDPPSWDNTFPEDMEFDLPEPLTEDENKKKTTTAAADTSSEVAKKLKEQFRKQMSQYVVVYLNPYRRPDCKAGRIQSTDDFKHLARRLTHHIMAKELKHCRHVEDLEVNENVKAKAKDYVKKYMSRCGPIFKKSSSPDDFA